MKYRFSLVQLRNLTLRQQRERAEWEDAYRHAVKREAFIHHAVRVIMCALVAVAILAILFG